MSPTEDLQTLMARVALKDRAAFERLYRLTATHLLGLAGGILQRRDAAEDVLQEAFMRVWSSAPSYNPAQATPMTWLMAIVRHQAIDRLRSSRWHDERSQTLDDDTLQLPAEPAFQPERQLDAGLQKSQIDRCMAVLAAPQRQALALAYFRGLVHTEIAEQLGAPLGSVKAWVRRGADRLRSCLEASGMNGA